MKSEFENILIVGSGFAGLVLAISLHQKKIPFRFFEAMDTPSNIGGSITIFPNGMRIFRKLGIAEQVIDSGATITNAKFQDCSGRHLVNRSMGTKERYGEPTVTIRRTNVINILLNKVAELGIEIEYGKKLKSIAESEAQIELVFTDESSVLGKNVVGCDGINSVVRTHVLEKSILPNYSNLIYFAAFVTDQEFLQKIDLDSKTQYISVGPKSFFAYSIVDNPKMTKHPALLWYCYLNQDSRLSRKELNSINSQDLLKRASKVHEGWHILIKDIISKSESFCKAGVSDIVEITNWSRGRAIIIGDAAHAMNPISGQGACTAMEDAMVLSKFLSRQDLHYSEIFNQLEKIRKPRVSKIAKKARRSSKMTTISLNQTLLWLRNYSFALLTFLTPERKLNWSFDYDADENI